VKSRLAYGLDSLRKQTLGAHATRVRLPEEEGAV
jgi:hypothetical protein